MNVLILLWNENVFCDTKFLLCFFWNVYLFSIVYNKTGSFNSFLFIYLTVINWDGNTKQRNLHLRLSPGFILHQCCYLNITVVVFVMRTKEYDFIKEENSSNGICGQFRNYNDLIQPLLQLMYFMAKELLMFGVVAVFSLWTEFQYYHYSY